MRFLRIIFNKYLLTAAGFIVLMMYFDQADWISQQARQQELNSVKDNISYLQTEVSRIESEYDAIRNDPQALEQYAREHYRMKRDTEDLYIVEK